ncbi:histamine H3 receptor-like [Lytechinus pictus]|uniref:histamine H3 receptor-like n=1 Tax=Lytechinus pictus TaxID=7653 RepID=UPI0030BA151E
MATTQAMSFSTGIPVVTTSNSTPMIDGDDSLFPHSLTWIIIVGIVYSFIILITLVGNAFVIAAYKVDERIRARPSSILILNLAISDFFIGITLIFNYVFLLYDEWPLGEIPCKLWTVLDYTCSYMSVVTITLISLDRYWMVKKKLGYRKYQTKKRILITLAICWSVVLAFYTITAFGYGAMTNTNHVDFSDDCEMEYLYSTPFSAVMITVEFVIPFFVILYLNIVVYMNIQMRTGQLVRSKPDKGHDMYSKTSLDTDKTIGTDSASGLAYSSNPLYAKKPVPIVTISYSTKDKAVTPNDTTESTDEKPSNAYEVDESFEESKASDEGIVSGGTDIAPNVHGFANPSVDVNDVDIKAETAVVSNSHNTNNNANHSTTKSDDGMLKVEEKTRPLSAASLNSVVSSKGHTTLARTNKEKSKKAREFRRQRRAAIVLFTLVITFGICWLPYQITTILVTIMGDGSINYIIEEIMTNLLWCNSTINPFLYAFVTVSFRRNFIRFLGLDRITWCQKKQTSDDVQDRIHTSDPTECDS